MNACSLHGAASKAGPAASLSAPCKHATPECADEGRGVSDVGEVGRQKGGRRAGRNWYSPAILLVFSHSLHEVLSNPCETPPKPRVPKTWSRKPWSHSSPCQSAFAPALLRKTYLCTVLPYHKYRYKRVNLCTEYPPAPMPHLQPCACDFIHRIRCLQIQAVPIRSGTPVPLR